MRPWIAVVVIALFGACDSSAPGSAHDDPADRFSADSARAAERALDRFAQLGSSVEPCVREVRAEGRDFRIDIGPCDIHMLGGGAVLLVRPDGEVRVVELGQ